MGMVVVSRMLISVGLGEEDRRTVIDVMRVMLKRHVPLMACVSALITLCAVPLTRLFFRDPSEPVYAMAVWGLRILPLYMPLSIICMHFACYPDHRAKRNMTGYRYDVAILTAAVRLEITDDPAAASITFADRGVPFDPLKKPDPDVSLSAEERQIVLSGNYLCFCHALY